MDKQYIQGYKNLQEDYDLPTEVDISSDISPQLADQIGEEICDILSDKYGFCIEGCSWSVVVGDILWDTKE